MLKKIVEILNISLSIEIERSTLFCQYTVADIPFLQNLYDSDYIENTNLDDLIIGNSTILEFSIPMLGRLGFYETKKTYLNKNFYEIPQQDCYIYEIKKFVSEDLIFANSHKTTVDLINSITSIAKITYNEAEVKNSLIIKEDKSLLLPFQYDQNDINSLNETKIESINHFIRLINNQTFEDKKNVYINFLIEFLTSKDEDKRFSFLLINFSDYNEKAQSTYNFYLRNFSYNKLKVELDSKTLEFNQKLQSVINDSQTKLIAIPTALVLVLSTLDYDNINSIKNYLSVVGLIIFGGFIQLFINNQKSMLNFISENIDHYKQTFNGNKIIEIEKSFEKVEKEKTKQQNRLLMIQLLLWLTPILTFSVILFLNSYKVFSIIILSVYLILTTLLYLFSISRNVL